MNKSYKAITNNAGKLPDAWREEQQKMLVRLGYLIFTYNIPPELLVNMDETPLKLTPSSGKTWAAKGGSNVFAFGAKDNRKSTGTLRINCCGNIIFFIPP